MADAERPGLFKSLKMNYSMTRKVIKTLPLWMLGGLVVGGAIGFSLLYFTFGQRWWIGIPGFLVFGLLSMIIVLGRLSQKALYIELEGEPGAAGRVLHMLRRGWKIEVPVAFNKNQDLVHRVVGKPGIILVGEGNPNRLKPLLASERKKHERVLADLPVIELIVGDAPGEVPLRKLTKTITKMKRQIKPADMTDVLQRLRALDASGRNLPIPKGPVPTSMKGMRSSMRGR